MIEIVALLACPILGALVLSAIGERREAPTVNIAVSLVTLLVACALAIRVMSGGPVVLLISDGWDRGEPEILRREVARLRRSCHRLIWLNPLLGAPDYQPLTRGMQAALPFVDDFLPVHNLESVEALARHLNALPRARR